MIFVQFPPLMYGKPQIDYNFIHLAHTFTILSPAYGCFGFALHGVSHRHTAQGQLAVDTIPMFYKLLHRLPPFFPCDIEKGEDTRMGHLRFFCMSKNLPLRDRLPRYGGGGACARGGAVPRRGGGREPCHSPKYFRQPYSSLPHRLRAEPPRRGGQGVSTPFSTVQGRPMAAPTYLI